MSADTPRPSDAIAPKRADDAALSRRRRARNWAMLAVLLAISALFYAIAMVKMASVQPGVH